MRAKRFKLKDNEFSRISSFLKHANLLFAESKFIKNLDTLEIVLFIYKENYLEKNDVNFTMLKEYSSKSEMYLSTFLKDGKELNYLNFKVSSEDKRVKNYFLGKNSYLFISKLKEFSKF